MVNSKTYGTLTQLPEFSGHSRKVYALGWNYTGTKLASGSTDKSIRLWDLESGSGTMELRGHSDAIHQLCWDPTSSSRLASTAADKTIRVWDAKAGRIAHSISMNAENFNIAYSHDGKYIATSNKECISLIDARKYRILHRTVNPYESNEIKFSKSGLLCVAAGHPAGHGTFEIMRISGKASATLENIHKVTAHSGNCFCLDFDPAQRYLAVGGVDSLVSLWDLEELYCVRTIRRSNNAVRSVSFSCDGQFLASGAEDRTIDIADVETGDQAFAIELQASMQYLSWHPKKLILAYVGDRSKNERDRDRNGIIKLAQIQPANQ